MNHNIKKNSQCSVLQVAIFSIALFLTLFYMNTAVAQTFESGNVDCTFSVESFRQLPTDVSASIDTVDDLNGEACALVKVVAPSDFAFSSPLGIVKRRDEVGEIWLYLPRGTKTLTLKHPQLGVLRNYSFGRKLESRMTYELRLRLPKANVVERHDTIVRTKTIIDTVTIMQPKRVVPLHAYSLFTASLHADGPSWGVLFAVMRRHGAYFHIGTNLHSSVKTKGTCNAEGYRMDTNSKPYYTGSTHASGYVVTFGAIHRLSSAFNIFEGIGYGNQTISWQLANEEGGGWLRNTHLSHKGFSVEAGITASVYRMLTFSLSALTITGKSWQASVGVGIRLGSSKVTEKRK